MKSGGADWPRNLAVLEVPHAVVWEPGNPFLYLLETSTGGDARSTRFGMREFHFDPATRQAMLNGKVCYLRGSSLTLHRFFGDPKCGGLPWDETWVRKFLVEIPHRMHWNAFRICIGPPPQQWLDIADEAGLLLQYEFPIWSDREPLHHKLWKEDEIERQLRDSMRDNWNHPSVVIWDASNETHWAFRRQKLVPAVRRLDLSGRPWENGYERPDALGDPFEEHPYFYSSYLFGKPPYFQLSDLEKPAPPKLEDWQARHAAIINEYDWLWLHRDGTPTELTKKVYDSVLAPLRPPSSVGPFMPIRWPASPSTGGSGCPCRPRRDSLSHPSERPSASWNWSRLPGRDITCWWPGPFGTASRGRPRSPGVRCGLRQRPPGFRLL